MNKTKLILLTAAVSYVISVQGHVRAEEIGTSWLDSLPQKENGQITIEGGSHFSALNADSLAVTASSSDPSVMEAAVSGNTIQLSAKGVGSTVVTVKGLDNQLMLTDQFQADVSKLGDITGDGVVTPADVLFVYQVINKKVTITEAQKKAIDMNDDGVITAADASLIMKTYTSGSSSQSVPEKYIVQWSNINDAPVLKSALPAQALIPNEVYQWKVPEGTFMDIDEDDTLAYSVSLENGQPLPAWLSFNESDCTFEGTPPDKEAFKVKITAKDQGHETVEAVVNFTIESLEVNEAPRVTGQVDEQLVIMGVQSAAVRLSNLFSDPDGDPLTFTVSSLEGSIASGAISNGNVRINPVGRGQTKLKVTASDGKDSVDTYIDVQSAKVLFGGYIDVNTKKGASNVTMDLAPYFSDTTTLRLMSNDNRAALSGKILSYSPTAEGTQQFWVISADHQAVRITVNVAAQSGSPFFFSEYLDAGDGRIALEIYNSSPERATGYELEMHQYDTKVNQSQVTSMPLIFQPWSGQVSITISDIFYDFFDIINTQYYNGEMAMIRSGKFPVAFVLKKNGQVMDVIGDLNGKTPIFNNGGTIVRKQGIYTGSKEYQFYGEWDRYPSGSFQFMGRHTP